MKKIMHVNFTMNIGGTEALLINILRNMESNDFEFIFLCYKNEVFDYEEELINRGIKIIKISDPRTISKIRHIREIKEVIKKEHIDIVHCHTGVDSTFVLLASKLAKVKTRITHVHTILKSRSNSLKDKLQWNIHKFVINKLSNVKIACSNDAGNSIFKNNNFTVLSNGIIPEKFKFNNGVRKELRDSLNIEEDEIILGHVGRFEKVKNQEFLLELEEKLLSTDKNYSLVLVGDGEDYEKIKKLAKEKNIDNKVYFLGKQKHSNLYYNMFDYFVFPSFYEGLGMVLIEAQANGLQCFASNTIPKDANLSGEVNYLSLKEGASYWALKIKSSRNGRLDNNFNIINSSQYNVLNTIQKLALIYKA